MFLVTVWCISVLCVQLDILSETVGDHKIAPNWKTKIRAIKNVRICSLSLSFRCPYSCLSIRPYLQLTLAAASSHVATIRKKNSSYINCISSQNTLPGCLWTLKRSAVASVIPDPGCMPKLRHQGRCPARPSQNEGAWADSSFQEGKSGTWD